MGKNPSRRAALKLFGGSTLALTAVGASLSKSLAMAEMQLEPQLKGKVKHSACRWCYKDIPLEDFCAAAKSIGLKSIELVQPPDWPVLKKHGLTAAVAKSGDLGTAKGFIDPANHEELIRNYTESIPKVAEAGYNQVICFSGNRKGIDEQQGLENAATALKKLMPIAEKHGVTLTMELLNSKVNHKDYMADRTSWGVALADKIGSERFKLLYDIYHMQIMEGDVIATIRKYHPYISHYHTGGVPGRNEIDDTQELNYPAIVKAILETGYTGYIGQEFIPKNADKLASLKQGVTICDIA